MLNALVLSLALAPVADDVELLRTFTPGQKLAYEVKSHLLAEVKSMEMSFFMPEEIDVNYAFNFTVEDAKSDGFASVLYERPTMTFIEGETAQHPPLNKVEKVGYKFRMTLSPINELTDLKDLSEKKEKTRKDGLLARPAAGVRQDPGIGRMIGELHGLAMFLGSVDSSLDFSPKLPLESVKPGDTWKKTVSYQPRELKGTDKQAVQRLDYTYRYDGLVPQGNGRVHQVTATLDLDTDAAKFLNQLMGQKPEESGLKELRLKLQTKIVFDLDEKTKTTVKAVANSTGGFSIVATQEPDRPVYEERLKGQSELRLVPSK